jgi:hypothetical protein
MRPALKTVKQFYPRLQDILLDSEKQLSYVQVNYGRNNLVPELSISTDG